MVGVKPSAGVIITKFIIITIKDFFIFLLSKEKGNEGKRGV